MQKKYFYFLLYGIFGLAILLGCLSVIERLVWVNAETYPVWLTEKLKSPPVEDSADFLKAHDLFDKTCGDKRGSLSVSHKLNGTFMRCDDGLSLDSWFKGVYKLEISDKN